MIFGVFLTIYFNKFLNKKYFKIPYSMSVNERKISGENEVSWASRSRSTKPRPMLI